MANKTVEFRIKDTFYYINTFFIEICPILCTRSVLCMGLNIYGLSIYEISNGAHGNKPHISLRDEHFGKVHFNELKLEIQKSLT